LDAVCRAYEKVGGIDSEVIEFIDDMSERYQWADLVICRSGALTVSELALVGVPSILVPFPYAVDDHQTLNAHALVDKGGAVLLPQSDLESGKLVGLLEGFARRPEQLVSMSALAKQAAKPNATTDVADICQQIIGGTV
jgi:UDP-N-acetylglucosamine--N-acetylmuramyl-(pentapeptide) pyrophosphoryl-undecaprenol N-acetylglucosamine transferase